MGYGSNPSRGKGFSLPHIHPDLPWDPPSVMNNVYQGPSSGVKQSWHEGDHPPSLSTKRVIPIPTLCAVMACYWEGCTAALCRHGMLLGGLYCCSVLSWHVTGRVVLSATVENDMWYQTRYVWMENFRVRNSAPTYIYWENTINMVLHRYCQNVKWQSAVRNTMYSEMAVCCT